MSSKKKVVTPTNLCPFPTIPEECADGWSFHFINGAKGLLTAHNNIGTTRLSLLALITSSELLNHLAPAHPQSVYWVNSRLYWMDGRGCSTRGSISIEQHEPIILTISLFQFFSRLNFFDTGYSPSSHHQDQAQHQQHQRGQGPQGHLPHSRSPAGRWSAHRPPSPPPPCPTAPPCPPTPPTCGRPTGRHSTRSTQSILPGLVESSSAFHLIIHHLSITSWQLHTGSTFVQHRSQF